MLLFCETQKSYLEVVVFLPEAQPRKSFKSVAPVSKTKFAHTFKLIHADQVEGELTEAIEKAFTV